MTHWISCKKMTVGVKLDRRETILSAAPVIRRFEGQRVTNLLNWLSEQGWGPISVCSLNSFRQKELW